MTPTKEQALKVVEKLNEEIQNIYENEMIYSFYKFSFTSDGTDFNINFLNERICPINDWDLENDYLYEEFKSIKEFESFLKLEANKIIDNLQKQKFKGVHE